MKKNLSYLAIILLTVCLVGFTSDQIVPKSTVHVTGEAQPVLSSRGLSPKEALPLTLSAHPVAFVVIGLIGVLVGLLAVAPLLIDDPALRKKAGICQRGDHPSELLHSEKRRIEGRLL